MASTSAPAPGARVVIRDEEWLIQSADSCGAGHYCLSCVGLSETVLDRPALFLTELEEVRVLDPAQTELVWDSSSEFVGTRLLVEARLRQAKATGDRLVVGHRGVMDPLPFQLTPTLRVLNQLRPRLLIADTTGVGKTLEAGILAAELSRRGRARRILVVTTKSMMKQLQGEFWNRFTIPLTRLDSAGIARIRREIPANHNPFHYYDRTIISIDTLKRDNEYLNFVEQAWWDLIIIDEAHNASYKGNRTLNNRLATLLAERSDALILLTATPHNGRKESFASLMRMLDPTVLPQNADYTRKDVEHLFVRRMKKDVREQMGKEFPDREVYELNVPATPEEERLYRALGQLKLDGDSRKGEGQMLFKTGLEKALFSSPPAFLETVRQRLKRLEETHPDYAPLRELELLATDIGPEQFSKFQLLLQTLRTHEKWRWDGKNPADRLVIFTERIATLNFLHDHLPGALGLDKEAVAIVHGGLKDVELQDTVESFGKTHSPLRLLLASDVASEGLNLHFQSFRLLHFDIPWSLMVFQQRNGRVDRYGQTRAPRIGYLMTEPKDEAIRGDLRILEVLIEKDTQAAKNIGDPSSFMGKYDEQEEERTVAQAMEEDQSAVDFAAALQNDDVDPLDLLFGEAEAGDGSEPGSADAISGGSSAWGGQLESIPDVETSTTRGEQVFEGDYAYTCAALRFLQKEKPGSVPQASFQDEVQAVSFQPDMVLAGLLKRELAEEMRPQDNLYTLSARRDTVLEAMEAARNSSEWPRVQYLWPLHPVARWLDWKVLAHFGRQRAPVARVPRGLAPGEAIVLLLAQVPNRRGQTVLSRWMGIPVTPGKDPGKSLTLQEVMQRTGFGEQVPNSDHAVDLQAIQAALPAVVQKAELEFRPEQTAFEQKCREELNADLAKLNAFRERHQEQLKLDFGGQLVGAQLARKRNREADLESLFTKSKEWARNTLELDARAQMTVVAVLVA